jgi:hypothetical protein
LKKSIYCAGKKRYALYFAPSNCCNKCYRMVGSCRVGGKWWIIGEVGVIFKRVKHFPLSNKGYR